MDTNKAIAYAYKQHMGQYRKGKVKTPFINHCISVGDILKETGYKDKVVIAGIVHDTIEDSNTTIRQLRKKFGKNVAKIVEGVTEKGIGMTWHQRLEAYIKRVQKAPPTTKAVSAADKIDNMESIVRCLKNNFNIFEEMGAGAQDQIKKFQKLYKILAPEISVPLKLKYEKALKSLIKYAKMGRFC